MQKLYTSDYDFKFRAIIIIANDIRKKKQRINRTERGRQLAQSLQWLDFIKCAKLTNTVI